MPTSPDKDLKLIGVTGTLRSCQIFCGLSPEDIKTIAGFTVLRESLAEAALASPTGYPADARAVESSTLLLVPKTPFLDFIGRRPDLALRMLGSMSSHLRVLVGMLDDLTLKDVESRLLNWLIKHSSDTKDNLITLSGTKRVLAAELGTSSETLSRTLGKLRDEKLITVDARTIKVHNVEALDAMLQRNLGSN